MDDRPAQEDSEAKRTKSCFTGEDAEDWEIGTEEWFSEHDEDEVMLPPSDEELGAEMTGATEPPAVAERRPVWIGSTAAAKHESTGY